MIGKVLKVYAYHFAICKIKGHQTGKWPGDRNRCTNCRAVVK